MSLGIHFAHSKFMRLLFSFLELSGNSYLRVLTIHLFSYILSALPKNIKFERKKLCRRYLYATERGLQEKAIRTESAFDLLFEIPGNIFACTDFFGEVQQDIKYRNLQIGTERLDHIIGRGRRRERFSLATSCVSTKFGSFFQSVHRYSSLWKKRGEEPYASFSSNLGPLPREWKQTYDGTMEWSTTTRSIPEDIPLFYFEIVFECEDVPTELRFGILSGDTKFCYTTQGLAEKLSPGRLETQSYARPFSPNDTVGCGWNSEV